MSGFSPMVRKIIHARAGQCCERCGIYIGDYTPRSVHHRRPRGMGGSKNPATNAVSNGLYLCGTATSEGGCHGWVEANRQEALDLGLICMQWQDPSEVPVQLHVGRVLLDDVGGWEYAA